MRPIPLITGEIYHIYSKSIQGFKIFNRPEDFSRMLALIQYCQWEKLPLPFSHFIQSNKIQQLGFKTHLAQASAGSARIVQIIAYCIMETHVHFILKQLKDGGISSFIQKMFSGYSQYFNLLHNRQGPLWQSRFGNRYIEDLGDLINTSHYVHANPVKDMGLCSPGDWVYSSYKEYCESLPKNNCICQWRNVIPINSIDYQESMKVYLLTSGK